MIKKTLLALFFLLLLNSALFSSGHVYRYGIFVASSKGYQEKDLPQAGKLVQGVANNFEEYCKLDEVDFLLDPGKTGLSAALLRAKEIIEEQKEDVPAQFFFYYYGHGNAIGMLFGDEIYEKELLKEKVAAIGAQLRFVFIDSCSSQILGAEQNQLDFTTKSEGTVYISSSTQFQDAYTNIFTPTLEAGLMGDADGFIPDRIDTPFFYNEISSKLEGEEKEFVCSLYGLSDYYEYKEELETDRKELEALFTRLGHESIPRRIHINKLEDEILRRVEHHKDEEAVLKSFGYSKISTLREDISEAEKEKLAKCLEKAGFKEDSYISLSELFAYIQSQVAAKSRQKQRATITTRYLDFSEPVPLSYFDNKVALLINYPGTIFIKKVVSENILENIIRLANVLDDSSHVKLKLEPGSYRIFVETEEAKYKVDVKLKPGAAPVVLEKLDWSTLVNYRDGEEWKDKSSWEKRFQLHKKTAWIAPAATFTSFTIPLSIVLSDLFYYYAYLGSQYNSEVDPNRIEEINARIDQHEMVRPYVYAAVGSSFTLATIPLIIWIVQRVRFKKSKNELNSIRSRFAFDYLPEFDIGPSSIGIALSMKIK